MFEEMVAIAGGIGSGKSTVCRVLKAIGYKVYDCDSRARQLMDNSRRVKEFIASQIDEACIVDGCIDRKRLASIVFSNKDALGLLNEITHALVRGDLLQWYVKNRSTDKLPLLVETAIVSESGIDNMVSQVWEVTAPEDLRVERVMKRNGITEAEVRARIASQNQGSMEEDEDKAKWRYINNDGITPVLPQILGLLSQFEA